MTELVLLGAGHAHLQVLRALAVQPLARAQVTLVSPQGSLLYSGMLPGLLAGHYDEADCTIAIEPLAARAGARFIQAAAVGMDAAARRLCLDDGRELRYDVLSVDIGSVTERDTIAGARELALPVRPPGPLSRRLQGLLAGEQERAPSLVVVGGGAVGFEIALALQFRLGGRSRVSLVSGAASVLEAYPAAVRRLGLRALQRRGIALFDQTCRQVDEDSLTLGDGTRLRCDVAVLAIAGTAPRWLAASGLALDERGFVATRATLQSTSHADVFAAGDVAARADAPRPRSGVFAVRAGAPLASNLRRWVGGEALQPYRPPSRSLNLLACGERRAIVAWGRFAAEGRWAWRWKDSIDRRFVAHFTGGTA